VSYAPRLPPRGFYFIAEYRSRTGCHLIDEFIPANVSRDSLKNLSFSLVGERFLATKMALENELS